MLDQRRKDTRDKITLGGLVVKAGLRDADRAFILGALLNAAQLDPTSPTWRALHQLGASTFNEKLTTGEQGPADAQDPLE
ncbi:MAG: conjugal transfer protein TraD [Sphingobium sp.]